MKYFSAKKQFWLISLSTLLCNSNYAQFTDQINTNRPSKSMGAYAVGKNIVQIEAGGTKNDSYTTNKDEYHRGFSYDLSIRTGAFFEQLEFIGQVQYKNTDTHIQKINGFESVELGSKILLYDSYKNYEEKINIYSWRANQRYKFRRLRPTIALYAGYKFYTPKNNILTTPNKGLTTSIITQQHLSKKWTFVTNWYAENIDNSHFTNIGYIATLLLNINTKTSIFIENQGKWYNKNTYQIPFSLSNKVSLGATYLISPNLQLDIHTSHTTNADPKRWQAGIGISWRNKRPTIWKSPYENINP